MIQVAHMNQIGANLVENLGKTLVDPRCAVAIFEAGIVDEVYVDARVISVLFRTQVEIGREGILLPREDVDLVAFGERVAQCLAVARCADPSAVHSWYPVCRGSLDDVVGVISVARLLQLGPEAQGSIEAHAVAATFVPETLSGMELLEQFRSKAGRLVMVVDEYGVLQGLVTPRDLLEAITGELQPDTPRDAWATPRDDGSWLLDGVMPVGELKVRLGVDYLPAEDRGRYNTVAGLLMSVSGRLPGLGERIECAGWLFEVVDLDGKRIDKVLATRSAGP